MVRDVVAMSGQELERVSVVSAVVEKRMRQRAAAERVGVTERQVKRLAARYRPAGPAGLAARWRGRRPNNAIAAATRREILESVEQRYADFPPTLAHEKLTQVHGYRLSVETLRQGLIEEGLWQPQARRLAFVDDATSRLLVLRLWEAETTQAYMQTLREYLERHGRPVALYSDQHSILRVNRPDREGEWTQFTRALQTLDIQPIPANTPPAKGRVERAFQTLQGRLPRELRLAGDWKTASRPPTPFCRTTGRTTTRASAKRRGVSRTRTGRWAGRPPSWTGSCVHGTSESCRRT